MDGGWEICCAKIAQSIAARAILRHEIRVDGKVMLRFLRAGFDEKAVSRSRFEWFGRDVGDGWLQPANVIAVGKHFCGHGIGVGFQFPHRKGIFIALKSAHGNHF